jgi:hypothetical protein
MGTTTQANATTTTQVPKTDKDGSIIFPNGTIVLVNGTVVKLVSQIVTQQFI